MNPKDYILLKKGILSYIKLLKTKRNKCILYNNLNMIQKFPKNSQRSSLKYLK